jgi:hypothetical protein
MAQVSNGTRTPPHPVPGLGNVLGREMGAGNLRAWARAEGLPRGALARDLVAASGTNLASIGYHFGSKEALLQTALLEASAEWGDELEQVLAAHLRPC